MKALSIKQPWASLIAHGIKDIENRTWKTHFRGRIFIHASAKSVVKKVNEISLREIGFTTQMIDNANEKLFAFMYHKDLTITSAIIGEVDIIDCVINHPSVWAEQTDISKSRQTTSGVFVDKPIYNWVLANPVLYDKPILNVKGKLSFWEFEKYKVGDIVECFGTAEIIEVKKNKIKIQHKIEEGVFTTEWVPKTSLSLN